jgi:hypothetical protein
MARFHPTKLPICKKKKKERKKLKGSLSRKRDH